MHLTHYVSHRGHALRPLSFNWRPSIRLQVTLCYTIVFALLIGCVGIVLYTHLQSSLVESLGTELHVRAQQIASDVHDDPAGKLVMANASSDLPGFEPVTLNQPVAAADVNFEVFVRVLDAEGKTYRLSPAFRSLNVPSASVTQPLQGIPWQGTVTTHDGKQVLLYSRTRTDDGKTLAIIQVGISLSQLNTALDSLAVELWVIGPIALLLSALLSYWLASRAFRPIEQLIRTAQRIKMGDLHQRVPVPASRDEVRHLAVTLNEMLEALDQMFARQRRFVADASHELRTPVAAIRSMTDVALLDPQPSEKYVAVLSSVNAETERLGRLISDLLALARADEDQYHFEQDSVRLDILLEAVGANAEALAVEKQIALEVEAAQPVTVIGDEARLIQAVMNLVDNAITYTNSGGTVTLTLQEEEKYARLTVRDTGIGIVSQHLPHIFERFYRVDAAHTHTEGGSSGLGLAIVKWVVEAHKGKISVESQPGQGSSFTILLPLPSGAKETTKNHE
jgi:heavy metal sensor kinase